MLSIRMACQKTQTKLTQTLGGSNFSRGEILIASSSRVKEESKSYDLAIIHQDDTTDISSALNSSITVIVDADDEDDVEKSIIREFMMAVRSPAFLHYQNWYNQLEAHYQPILDMQDQSITGYELLSRINCGSDLIMPELALYWLTPLENVLIIETIIRQAQIAFGSIKTKLFLNIDCASLVDVNSFKKLRAILSSHIESFPGLGVVLEITEAQLDRSNAHGTSLDTNMAELSRLGVHFAIDDFGSEASNYDRLRRFKKFISIVKVDKTHFWSVLHKTQTKNSLAIVELIRSIGINRVIIEGVEELEHLSSIEQAMRQVSNVSLHAQGFLLGIPSLIPVLPSSVEAV